MPESVSSVDAIPDAIPVWICGWRNDAPPHDPPVSDCEGAPHGAPSAHEPGGRS